MLKGRESMMGGIGVKIVDADETPVTESRLVERYIWSFAVIV